MYSLLLSFFKYGLNYFFFFHCYITVSTECVPVIYPFHLAILSTSIEGPFIEQTALDQSGQEQAKMKADRRLAVYSFLNHSHKDLLESPKPSATPPRIP